jgi:hypothetical protein
MFFTSDKSNISVTIPRSLLLTSRKYPWQFHVLYFWLVEWTWNCHRYIRLVRSKERLIFTGIFDLSEIKKRWIVTGLFDLSEVKKVKLSREYTCDNSTFFTSDRSNKPVPIQRSLLLTSRTYPCRFYVLYLWQIEYTYDNSTYVLNFWQIENTRDNSMWKRNYHEYFRCVRI